MNNTNIQETETEDTQILDTTLTEELTQNQPENLEEEEEEEEEVEYNIFVEAEDEEELEEKAYIIDTVLNSAKHEELLEIAEVINENPDIIPFVRKVIEKKDSAVIKGIAVFIHNCRAGLEATLGMKFPVSGGKKKK